MKDKNHMILSIDAEKVFDMVQHLFLIKALSKLGVDGAHLHIVKNIYKKTTTNILLNGQKVKGFPVRSRIR